jgi:hypothetical protein
MQKAQGKPPTVDGVHTPPGGAARRLAVALFVATGLALAFATLLGPPTDRRDRPSTTAVNPTGAVNVPDPAPVDSARWRAAFPLTSPPIRDAGDSRAAAALRKALVPFRKEDYAAAATLLEGVWSEFPDEHRAALYLGITRLFQDEVPNGIEMLRAAEASPDPDVAAEAQWYAIVGVARLRDPREAERMARALCSAGGSASGRACSAVGALAARP